MTVTNFDPAILDLPEFIRACVERAGGVVDVGNHGRFDALLPPALEAAAGGRSWVSLALGNDAGDADAEPATLGSPFMDTLIAFAAGRGTAASGHLPAGRLKRKGLREEVERTLRFSNCRTRYLDDEGEVLLSATAQFDFKVAFLSEERRERVYVVPVNLFSSQVDLELAARLPELPIEADAAGTPPEIPLVPVGAAYEAARRALRRLVVEEAARQQVRVARRFAVEVARISDYYAQAIEGLERRRDRERRRSVAVAGPEAPRAQGSNEAAAGSHADRADAFAPKVDAAHRERERKLRELGETYGIRTRARLASVRWLWQPKVFFKLLLDRGSVTRTLILAYDGLQERLESPSCESCRQPTTRLQASSTARLLCPACSAGELAASRP
jgi:hypothetical protein